jgi:hypothetical protein
MPSGALVGIDVNLDCVADNSFVLNGPVQIQRSDAQDDSLFYPGARPLDGHLDVIDTEIVAMSLTGGSLTLTAGAGLGNTPLDSTFGVIAENLTNPALGDSFFDVFFEVELGGGNYLYNQDAVTVTDTITCIPPVGDYLHPVGCTPLYTSPIPGGGVHVANLVSARHETFPVPRDRWRTWRYIGQKDQNFQDFSDVPIPAGFFDPGSLPFEGRIEFDGKPINQDAYGDADTEILRAADPITPADPVGSVVSVDIQIVELSLISIHPMTVRYSGSAAELWDVSVGLSAIPQPFGGLTATKTHANGGTFNSVLPVMPRFVFTRREDGATRILDAGLAGMPPIVLEASSVGFVHSLDPSVDI